jgi:DNA-binding winged helix-turn-helix (wHTH) protein/TolB-like protein
MPGLTDASQAPLRLGSWQFYPELNRIRDSNSVIHLEPKAALVLKLLVERAGKPVTRQELLETVWSDVVVSDDALTQVIIKLRKALGDDARSPRYIRTIPKRGYCLVADVGSESGLPETVEVSGKRRNPTWAVAALAVILMVAVLAYLLVDDSSLPSPVVEVRDETPPPEGATLAVMPFEAVTGNEREQRFARGMRSDLVTDLGKLSDLQIIRPSPIKTAPVASRYQVFADVQQVGDRIGVHVRLIETESAQQLWSQRYLRKLDDVFQVQHSISQEVVRQLALEVTAADLQRLADRYTPSVSAYEDFLRGQAELLRREREANATARLWYRKAIERDPNFARAYGGLALSYAADYRNQWTEDGEKALRLAEEMAQTGAQIDPRISEVYWVLGYVAAQEKKHERALTYLQQALETDHSYADAYALMGGINTYIGRPEHTIGQLRKAMHLNENAGYLYYLLLGRAYYFTNKPEQAAINLRESLARNPINLETHIYLLATAISREDADAADWEAEEIRAIEPGFTADVWLETYPMTDEAQIERLAKALAHYGM